MLGFILSKLNLLILVTAVFAVVVFFTFSLNDFFVVQKANEISDTISAQVTALITSPSYCVKNLIQIPDELSYLGGRKVFYVLEIASVQLDNQILGLKFTLLDRRDKTKVLASTRINLPSTIHMQVYRVEEGAPINTTPESSVILDPQSVIPIDAFYLAKEIYKGEQYIFIVPCSTRITADNCGLNANIIAGAIGRERGYITENDLQNVCLYG